MNNQVGFRFGAPNAAGLARVQAAQAHGAQVAAQKREWDRAYDFARPEDRPPTKIVFGALPPLPQYAWQAAAAAAAARAGQGQGGIAQGQGDRDGDVDMGQGGQGRKKRKTRKQRKTRRGKKRVSKSRRRV